ncbi:sperm annulus positionning complex subunit Chibby3 [Microcaecilia unicolor]|uniref:Protein chibby homolog 3 n=1 Tax=Microcaecilia unicolor TaxID=1415580 RepID=A0A6P7YPK4_9AMPH|nr:protein chibby homolog 3 [Microcaecilia unicolor]
MDIAINFNPYLIRSLRKFHPKRSPLRRANSASTFYLLNHKARLEELGLEYGPPSVRLNGMKYVFKNGTWVNESQNYPAKPSYKKLLAKNKALIEQNNYLKLQMELLMDMLTEATAQLHTLEDKLGSKIYLKSKGMKEPRRILMLQSKE